MSFHTIALLLAGLLGLSIVVLIHELGHATAALLTGCDISEFSIGFGPPLWSFRRGLTEIKFCLLPLGGYVRIVGDASNEKQARSQVNELTKRLRSSSPPLDENSADRLACESRWLINKHSLIQGLVVVSGPLFSFLFVAPIFFCILTFQGVQVATVPPTIASIEAVPAGHATTLEFPVSNLSNLATAPNLRTEKNTTRQTAARMSGTVVVENSPANGTPDNAWSAQTGKTTPLATNTDANTDLLPGDIIRAVNGTPVQTVADVSRAFENKVQTLTIERQGNSFVVQVQGTVRIRFQTTTETVPWGKRLALAAASPWKAFVICMTGLYHIFVPLTTENATPLSEQLAGPVGILSMGADAMNQGALMYLQFLAGLSASLGAINLLPVFPLDGGRLLILALRGVFSNKMPEEFELVFMYAGLGTVLLLFLTTLVLDLSRLVT